MPTNASQGVVGYGSSIAYAPITAGTPGTYSPVVQTLDISSPEQEVGDVKITNNSSPNNTHEYLPGMLEPGDLEFEVVYYKAGHEALLNLLGNQIVYSWQETFTDGTTCTAPGYLKSAKLTGKTEDDALKGTIKIKLTGKAVYA